MSRFDNKTALITGGASGIGAASVKRFFSEGANIVIADMDTVSGEKLVAELGEERVAFVKTNVSDWASVQAMVAFSVEKFGRIDVLFNNAGIDNYGLTPDLDVEQWRKVITIDLDSVFYGCKAVIPVMRENGGGAIINTASASGLAGDYGMTAYNAAKGGVVNYTRAVAVDHAKENIRVNAICPGPVATPIIAKAQQIPGLQEAWDAAVPMGRFAKADEIAAVVVFLASDDASYVTGSIMSVDGGLTAHTGQPNITNIIANAKEVNKM
ncbi:Dihydroanticapsin 7-dehydrogenase [Zhongshania aliphaticivorans]|uniref:Dihydroanticapsin 7-dehydrogenase n=1 Tax=Zhongshania aliphaticivorans TaxID=1470434 RepID=A0A5S9NRA7_9GAMM|nr:SDR family NAD(P)-dependent oxidoreductase [Zhongshania aliphaticivorans]CAA0093042.1 Dihydroanticapsin 7-dehydrogenase [Zhongshania aliphaticivorans]CAA0110776.1 Dihydroanticapsin 7-dehydrogenase [Zhongshania aliphaticivorans]